MFGKRIRGASSVCSDLLCATCLCQVSFTPPPPHSNVKHPSAWNKEEEYTGLVSKNVTHVTSHSFFETNILRNANKSNHFLLKEFKVEDGYTDSKQSISCIYDSIGC